MAQEDILIFLRPVSPVVGMFILRAAGNGKESDITGNNKCISGYALNHGAINTEVIFFSSLTGVLLKTTDNMDFRNSRPGIEEKLWTETDTVMYGLFRRVVKKFNRLLLTNSGGREISQRLGY
ncbi:hypothetical protein P7V88_004245 [Salmonella enterica]|nr:hypothetical protein [Salmonella enterica subsp. enterica]EHW1157492.1 hypothetical protein [Salmonella enterica subsp. enterica serovar Takoradi]EKR0895989.1 hypothetical protein [Salmonella enterica]